MLRLSENARPPIERRAFSLLEMMAVVTIVGLIGTMAALRWSDQAIASPAAHGFARKLAMSLQLARRQTICEGTSAAVVLSENLGVVTSFHLVRAASGGDEVTDTVISTPSGVTVSAPATRWEYDYSGSLTTPASGGTITVSDGVSTWSLVINSVTGRVQITKS